MPKHKVGDRVLVKLSGGTIVEATIKAIVDTTEGVRLQVHSDRRSNSKNIFVADRS